MTKNENKSTLKEVNAKIRKPLNKLTVKLVNPLILRKIRKTLKL